LSIDSGTYLLPFNPKTVLAERNLKRSVQLTHDGCDDHCCSQEREASLKRFQDFKERMKRDYIKQHKGKPPSIAELLGQGREYSVENIDSEEDGNDGLNHENMVDKPLYDLQSQDKLEFKRFLRLQREGLVSLKDIF
jgi:hypothetical protein